ncbi:lysozyme inhibitor LprI family protein [Dyella sp.]|uniref:lysozyme inhibitor LprI family protein n=1 Tax=Dyella sp. TaxID=1869338 RepID=UPI002ED62B2A
MRPWIAMAALIALPLAAHAASFDCAKASSTAEKAVCADADLSQLDGDLGKAFVQAMSAAGNSDALRTSQRAWLKQRDACGSDKRCLQRSYRQRLDRLHGTASSDKGGDARWTQTWQLDSGNPSVNSQIDITGKGPTYHFDMSAANGGNMGRLEGDITVANDRAHFDGGADAPGCTIDFVRVGQRLTLKQSQNDCGAGNGVYYAGTYLPASVMAAKPKADLVSLKILDAAQNTAARQLLGKDYQTLVDDVNVCGNIDDKDGLGASVTDCFVRGLAPTNAAVVMSKGSQLWIGMLVLDKQNNSRLRYYTNVPAWKHKLPRTIQAWHDEHDKTLPVDLMP